MKLVLQIAGGILLAGLVLFILNIARMVAPEASGFFGVLLREPGFYLIVAIFVGLGIAVRLASRKKNQA